MQRFSFSSFTARVQTRWQHSWWNQRVEFNGGLLGACGHERVQPKIAAFAILGLLVGQTFLPGVMLLSNVQAAELRQSEALEAQKKQREAQTPAWAKAVEARVAQEERERNLRLTQGRGTDKKDKNGGDVVNRPPLIPVPGSKPGQVVPSSELDCPDCEIDVRALDLTRVPTEKELRRAGQLGGALNPTRSAEPQELGLKLDKLVKRAGIEGGLKAQLPPSNPRARGLQKAKEKFAQAEAINLDFGKAIQEWNKHNYREAAKMFKKHLKDYPNSPWGGEAMLHLGCDAKYNGRFDEAQNIYDTILKNTSDKPNKKLKKARRERKERGGGPDAAELEAEVSRAAQGTQSLEVAVEKLDVASEEDDESFELHMKAMARWADLDIATGRWNNAAKKLQHIVATDTDWRRRTWAQNWLTNLGPQATRLAMCGPQALQYVLAGLSKDAAAKKVGAVVPKTLAGLSLAEMETLADQNGAAMTTFKVADETQNKIARLADLPLPAIVHTDNARGFDETNSYFADRELKRAPLVAVHPDAAKKGVLPAKVSQQMSKDKGGAAVSLAGDLFGTQLPTTGHYLVLEKVNGKTRTARLFDPSAKRYYQLSWEQLANKWSGKGLALGGQTRLAALSKAENEGTRGGCCGSFEPPTGTGNTPANQPVCPTTPCDPYGEPVVSINRTNLNVYARDIPLWYTPGKGPKVEMDMSYNSQDGLSQRNAFGNKWMFTYGMYVVEDTQAGGGQVLAVMGDGSVSRYYPNSSGNGYTTQGDNLNRLEKLGPYRYSLTFPGGGAALFDIPPGTSSLQPFLLELRDANGYALTFTYNAQVQLTTITDALGQQTRLQYNAAGYATKVWDPFGRYASFGYDASGNLTEAIDMEGHSFQYSYDTVYNGTGDWQNESVYLTRLNSAKGATLFSHSYGYPSRDLTVTDVMGNSETFHGEWWGPDRYSYTDKRGVAQGYSVTMTDSYKARISQQRLPDGTTVSKGIDPQTGWVTSVTDARGKTTSLQLNGKGQVTQVTDPKGNTTTATYAVNGLDATSVTNANGVQVASATYNATHQPLSVTDEDGTTTFSYTAWGAPSVITSPDGKTLSYSYNAKGQVAQINFAGNAVAGFTYDEVGRVRTATDELGTTIGYQYNNLDAVTKVTYPDGTTQETDYTCCRLPGVVKDRSGRKSYYDYDPLRRLTRVQDAQGNTLQMDYDREGQMVRLVDAKGNLTKWNYDGLGRATKKLYHDGQSEEFAYYQGLLSQSKNARGQITKYGYDANGNVTGIDYPNMADVSLTYNALDAVTQIVDGVGTHTFSYSTTGRTLGLDGPWANDGQSYNFDAQGRLQSQSLERGASGGVHTQSYAYDALERLQSLTSGGAGGAGTFAYSYVGTSGMLDTLQLPNGTRTVQSYDSLQRLTQTVNQKNGGAILNKFAYAYDTRDVRTAMQSQHGSDPLRQVGYSYDGVDQLVGENATGGVAGTAYSNAFTYDAMGNRTKQITSTNASTSSVRSSVNALNQVTALSSTVNGGPRVTSGFGYDDAGNTTRITGSDGSKTLFSYDDADRLFRIEKRSAADAPLSKSEFVYDFASRKAVSREFTYTNGAWNKTGEKRRVFDGLDVIQERNDQNEVTAQLVRDGNIGGILARSTAGGVTFYSYDGGGNVTLLTDENGDDVGRYRYDAFGNTLEAVGSRAAENPYRFSTKELHAQSGLYDYGYRFYSPGLGRWINRDPIREAGGVNLYAMVGNSPTNSVDAYGLMGPGAPLWQRRQSDAAWRGFFSRDTFSHLPGDAKKGAYAAADGANPLGDPLADKGYYDRCESWVPYSQAGGAIGGAALAGAAGLGGAGAAGIGGARALASGGAVAGAKAVALSPVGLGAASGVVKSGFESIGNETPIGPAVLDATQGGIVTGGTAGLIKGSLAKGMGREGAALTAVGTVAGAKAAGKRIYGTQEDCGC